MDSVEQYLDVFESLRRRKRWSTGINVLQFAALTLAASDVANSGANLRAVQAIIEAQQAAMVACMAACAVTTTAATS